MCFQSCSCVSYIVAETRLIHPLPSLRLEGGTALAAYHLSHRESGDLDFFADPALNAPELARVVSERAAQAGLQVEPAGPQSLGFVRLVARDPVDRSVPSTRLDFAVTSAYRLAPLEPTSEGVDIASYRHLCAGKLHAICDRFEPRDFVDLHAILHAPLDDAPEPSVASRTIRFRAIVRDVMDMDPGLDANLIGQALERGMGHPMIARLPLRLIAAIEDREIQETVQLCVNECARMVRERLDAAQPPG